MNHQTNNIGNNQGDHFSDLPLSDQVNLAGYVKLDQIEISKMRVLHVREFGKTGLPIRDIDFIALRNTETINESMKNNQKMSGDTQKIENSQSIQNKTEISDDDLMKELRNEIVDKRSGVVIVRILLYRGIEVGLVLFNGEKIQSLLNSLEFKIGEFDKLQTEKHLMKAFAGEPRSWCYLDEAMWSELTTVTRNHEATRCGTFHILVRFSPQLKEPEYKTLKERIQYYSNSNPVNEFDTRYNMKYNEQLYEMNDVELNVLKHLTVLNDTIRR